MAIDVEKYIQRRDDLDHNRRAGRATTGEIEDGTWQELPTPPPGAHYHFCSVPTCDSYLTCFSQPDRCPLPAKWVCPTCERDAVDAWLSGQEPKA